jgi:hypothetical protein
MAEPQAELHRQALVEAEARAQVGEVGRRRLVAQHQGRGIARNQPDQDEDRRRHDQQGRQRHQDPVKGKAQHGGRRRLRTPPG